jgi:hypothetical protein
MTFMMPKEPSRENQSSQPLYSKSKDVAKHNNTKIWQAIEALKGRAPVRRATSEPNTDETSTEARGRLNILTDGENIVN